MKKKYRTYNILRPPNLIITSRIIRLHSASFVVVLGQVAQLHVRRVVVVHFVSDGKFNGDAERLSEARVVSKASAEKRSLNFSYIMLDF